MAQGEYQHLHAHHGHRGHTHPDRMNLAFAIGVSLNVIFIVVEAASGYFANSVALIADAAHNLGDVLGLALAWAAMALARRTPTERRTYGWRKSTILAALANAVLIFVAVGGVAWEGFERLFEPAAVEGVTVMVVAAIGVIINGVSAGFFLRGREHDANIRGAFLHLATDAAVSVGVVLAGVGILFTGWNWLDPALSLVVAIVIAWSTWGLLRDAFDMAMDAVPDHIDTEQVEALLASQDGVESVHDLHIWPLSTTEIALTAHIVLHDGRSNDVSASFLPTVCRLLHERFSIDHATLQLESAEVAQACRLAFDGAP